MLVQAAEVSFQQGVQALSDGREREAMAYFEAAVELERRFGVTQPQPRYLSFYGLCLGLTKSRLKDATALCRAAVSLESYNPEFRWNLGRVHLVAERRKYAWEAFQQGLRLAPNHAGIRRSIKRMGWRKRPVIPFLSRGNPINVFLGRRRAARNGR